MRIRQVLLVPITTASYYDDQTAIRAGAERDGFAYVGDPVSPGFDAIRQPGEGVGVMLRLQDGSLCSGDCTAVQYAAAGGRDGIFLARTHLGPLADCLRRAFEGTDAECFRESSARLDRLTIGDRPLHRAAAYGVSQALLDATSRSRRTTAAEVIADEYGLVPSTEPIRCFAQCGEDRYGGVDRMILKDVEVLPHGLMNSPGVVGERGELLREYLRWVLTRITALRRDPGYRPRIHIDTYGVPGMIFEGDHERIATYLSELEADAGDLELTVESPIDAGGREEQIAALGRLRRTLESRGSRVRIAADEWCNTLEDVRLFARERCCHMIQIKTPDLGGLHNSVEAVLSCREEGVDAYLGGSANETDVSARACAHLAMATCPAQVLVKPGLGFDEGLTVTRNEMARVAAILQSRSGGTP